MTPQEGIERLLANGIVTDLHEVFDPKCYTHDVVKVRYEIIATLRKKRKRIAWIAITLNLTLKAVYLALRKIEGRQPPKVQYPVKRKWKYELVAICQACRQEFQEHSAKEPHFLKGETIDCKAFVPPYAARAAQSN